MLMTIGGLAAAAILLVFAFVSDRSWLKKFVLGGVAIWFLFYGVLLLVMSLTSRETNLGNNEPKEFCGFYLDCHMHTEVTGVRTAKNIGDKTANGEFYIVNLKVFSDARNPAIALRLLKPQAVVMDENGATYARNDAAEQLLPTANLNLGADVKNDETIEKEIVFDLPEGIKNPRLDIREGYGVDHVIEAVLIGDEDSILHKRIYFKLLSEPEAVATWFR